MAPLSHFSEEKLNTYIQKALPEKTKIARKYVKLNSNSETKMNLKYQFDSFTRQIVANVSLALVV